MTSSRVCAARGSVTTGDIDHRLQADFLWRIRDGVRTSLDDPLEGDTGLVHGRGAQKRRQTNHPGSIAALVALDTARKLALQLKLEGVVRVHGLYLQTMFIREQPVDICEVLILAVFGGCAECSLHQSRGAGSGNVIAAVRQFHAQQGDRHGIDIDPLQSIAIPRVGKPHIAAPRRAGKSAASRLSGTGYRVACVVPCGATPLS